MLIKNSTETSLVELVKDQPVTTSLLVAEKFKKRHDHVLEKIRNLKCSKEFHAANFREMSPKDGGMSYKDSYGREQKFYEMTEEGFMFVAMRFTGKEAVEWQEKFIKAFKNMKNALEALLKQQSNKVWLEARESAKTSFKFMNTMLLESRKEQGKETKAHHYSNEAKLVNYALTGEFKGLNRNTLSDEDLNLLFTLQAYNSKMIARDVPYSDRKKALTEYAENSKYSKNSIEEPKAMYLVNGAV